MSFICVVVVDDEEDDDVVVDDGGALRFWVDWEYFLIILPSVAALDHRTWGTAVAASLFSKKQTKW